VIGFATNVFASGGTAEFPLSALILIPAVGAVLVALLPRSRPELFRQIAVLISIATGAVSIWLLASFESGVGDFQVRSEQSWVSDLGISWILGVDGISLFLIVLTGILFPIAIMADEPERDAKQYYAWLLLLEAGCMGVFMALDLVIFFMFFEIVLVPMYFLIGRWGHGDRVYAATKFFIYTMAGSALMLVGIVTLAVLDASRGGHDLTFSLEVLANSQALAESSVWTARFVFLSFALAFAVKVPIFPLHTWLPDAHTEAPTAGSVILAGVMLKLGTYGFLRFGLFLFPEASVYFAPFFIALGVIGILYGAIVATMQRDLKRLVAYSSIAHLGFVVMGIFALNSEGITGGLLQMFNHGVSTGALFLLVGMIYSRRHTRMIDELGGLQKPAPIMAGVFMLVMLSSIGLPGLNGFVGEYLTLLGAFLAHRWWAAIATFGVILAALYLLWAYQRVFHGPAEGDNAEMADLRFSEGLLLLPLLGLIVFMGVYPKPVIERMEPSVDALIAHVEEYVDDFTEPTSEVLVATGEQRSESAEGAHE
jgi:NADH-quinone oxidoreductase subunit M